MFLTGFTSFSILLPFPLSITFFVLCTVFNYILFMNVFVFGHFNIHHKDWLTYSGGTDDLVNCYNLSISNLSTMVSPPLGNSDHIVVSVFNDFPSNSPKQNALFHHIAYDYSCADWDGLCVI